MHRHRSVWLVVGTMGLAGCAGHTPPASVSSSGASAAATGVLPATHALSIDVGVSYLRLTMEDRDSIAWSLETKPRGCASSEVSPGRIEIGRRDRHCSTRWDIRIPVIEDVRVRASVGDIDVFGTVDRAIRLDSGVGSVRLRLDGRELRSGKSPGSGDEVRLGDLTTLPRLDVHTGVGWVHAEMRTVRR
jgi:hypothetical protein